MLAITCVIYMLFNLIIIYFCGRGLCLIVHHIKSSKYLEVTTIWGIYLFSTKLRAMEFAFLFLKTQLFDALINH